MNAILMVWVANHLSSIVERRHGEVYAKVAGQQCADPNTRECRKRKLVLALIAPATNWGGSVGKVM